MTEEKNTNEITYDDGWQNVSYPEYSAAVEDEEREKDDDENLLPPKAPLKPHKTQILVTVQLVICVIIAIAALLIKAVGGDFYKSVREWYYTELNKSIIAESNGDGYSLDEIFGTASDDEV